MQAPIPGESLTNQPKNFNWERPPEITDPDQAAIRHIERLQDEDTMNAVLDLLEFGELNLKTVVEGITRGAVAAGVHSIDVSLIVAPLIHEYIKGFADELGVEYDEGIVDKKAKEQTHNARVQAKAQKKLEELGLEPTEDFVRDDIEEDVSIEDVVMEETVPTEEPKGLGARRPKGGM